MSVPNRAKSWSHVCALGIDDPVRMERDGQKYYYHAAALGTVTEITSTNGTLSFVGPGKDAPTKATVQAATNVNAILIDPTGAQTASVVIDGLRVVGSDARFTAYRLADRTKSLPVESTESS